MQVSAHLSRRTIRIFLEVRHEPYLPYISCSHPLIRKGAIMKQLGGVKNHHAELDDLPEDLHIREFPGVTL